MAWSQILKPVNFCSTYEGFSCHQILDCVYKPAASFKIDLNPGHTGSVNEPSLWCFLTSLLNCLMSLYAFIGGNGGRMRSHLLGNVSCPYGSSSRILVYTLFQQLTASCMSCFDFCSMSLTFTWLGCRWFLWIVWTMTLGLWWYIVAKGSLNCPTWSWSKGKLVWPEQWG